MKLTACYFSTCHHRRAVARLVRASALLALAFPLQSCSPAGNIAASNDEGIPVPDLSGLWAREYIGYDPPASGPGPITNTQRIRTGQSNLDFIVGDYANPILKVAAAEAVKKHGEIAQSGTAAPDPYNQCAPLQPPLVLFQQEIQLIQQKDEVTILYMHDHHVRHVRLNSQHPTSLTPSWSGDSVGRYEGDALVVDTLGIKVGPFSMADMFGSPQSESLHLMERYRAIDYEASLEAEKISAKEHIHVTPDNSIGDGIAVDPDYKGKALRVEFTVEDPDVFTTPWSATLTYRRALSPWLERVCSENTFEYYSNKVTAVPTAVTPDF